MQRLATDLMMAINLSVMRNDQSHWFLMERFLMPQLRSELQAKGVSFRSSHSDTEVIPRLYEKKA